MANEKYRIEIQGILLKQIRFRLEIEDKLENNRKVGLAEEFLTAKQKIDLYAQQERIDKFIAQYICDTFREMPF